MKRTKQIKLRECSFCGAETRTWWTFQIFKGEPLIGRIPAESFACDGCYNKWQLLFPQKSA